MKNKLFLRILAVVLVFVMAVPTAAYAAEEQTSAGQPKVLYQWQASGSVGENTARIKDNLRANGATTHWAYDLTVNTADGPKAYSTYNLINSASSSYGLPYKSYNSSKSKATESLKLELLKFPQIRAKDYGAINLCFDYAYTPDRIDNPVFVVDKLKVQVSIDSKTWLEGSVGIRSWELIGSAEDPSGMEVYIIHIETNDLLEIEDLQPGDYIRGIRLLPHGDFYYTFGSFGMANMTVTGWPTKEAFETAVPDERTDLLDIGEEKMRNIVTEHADMFANVSWVSDADIYSHYEAAGVKYYDTYGKGILNRGLVYNRTNKLGYELFKEAIVDGKYVAGYTTASIYGADCMSYAYDAYSRISRSYSYIIWQTQSDNALELMGNLKTDDSPTYTDTDIIPYNTEQEMYEAYALMDQADIMTNYTTLGGIHIRIAREPAKVVRNSDGTINPDESYIITYEQTSRQYFYFRAPDGTVIYETTLDPANMPEAVETYLANHPGYEFLYTTSTLCDAKYTFRKMLETYYVPLTLKEYKTGKVENIDVQMLLQPKDFKDIASGFRAVVMADYHIGWLEVALEDKNTNQVLYKGRMLANNSAAGNPITQRNYGWQYTDDGQLDAKLAALPNGDYRLAVSVLGGPVTEVRAERPVTTEYYEFSVADSETKQVSVSVAPSAQSVAAGQTLEVQVTADTAFKAADVEVAYDADKLTFVGGSVTANCLLNSVDAKDGVVRIMAVDANSAGQLAKLTFTAKATAGADAVSVKNAIVEPGEGGGSSQPAHTCPAAAMTDVAADAWYHTAVDYALTNGLMSGYNATTFGPNDTLSRAMVVQVLYNKEGKPALTAGHSFPDVASGDWFNNAVAWGSEKGVVSGFGDGKFRPNDAVTLEQVAVILHNYSGKPAASGEPTGVGKYDDWAKQALSWAVAQGIMRDVPFTNATENATRAQTAQMLMNYLKSK